MLTKIKNLSTDIIVLPDSYLCVSDHYLITFKVKSNLKRIKIPKRKIFNFFKANWKALNHELGNINWDVILDCMEPVLTWLATHYFLSYRKTYSVHLNKADVTSPWFDAECLEAYTLMDKERPIQVSKVILRLKKILKIMFRAK